MVIARLGFFIQQIHFREDKKFALKFFPYNKNVFPHFVPGLYVGMLP